MNPSSRKPHKTSIPRSRAMALRCVGLDSQYLISLASVGDKRHRARAAPGMSARKIPGTSLGSSDWLL
jgi:hypothetical protein